MYKRQLVAHVLANYTNENILIIGDSSATSISNSDAIRSVLLLHDSITEAKIIYPDQGYIRKDYIINALKPDIGNWVLLATDNRVISSDVINSLISLPVEDPEEDEEDEEDDDDHYGDNEDIKPEVEKVQIVHQQNPTGRYLTRSGGGSSSGHKYHNEQKVIKRDENIYHKAITTVSRDDQENIYQPLTQANVATIPTSYVKSF